MTALDTRTLASGRIGRLRISLEWKLPDLWIGVFFTRSEAWICLVPCFPIHVELVDDYEEWFAACVRDCTCCPSCHRVPCDGAITGGFCDRMRCSCDDEPDEYYGEEYDDGPF